MAGFLGEYEATIDAKGRFLLPGGIKKQMPEGSSTIVISRGFEKCLLLYPQKSWEGVEEKLKKLNEFNPEEAHQWCRSDTRRASSSTQAQNSRSSPRAAPSNSANVTGPDSFQNRAPRLSRRQQESRRCHRPKDQNLMRTAQTRGLRR